MCPHPEKQTNASTTCRPAADTLLRYISTNQRPMRYDVFGTKGYHPASGAAEPPCNNVAPRPLSDNPDQPLLVGHAGSKPVPGE